MVFRVPRLIAGAAFALVVVGATFAGPLPAAAASCGSGVPHDINGDGYAEVAVGESGAVHVLYGHRRGLVTQAFGTALDDQYFTRSGLGVPGISGRVGRIDLGDFNGDGCSDLAVGSQHVSGAGMVVVLYGSTRGVTTARAQGFTMATLFGPGRSAAGQEFGRDLAVGDLNGDGIDDLAIGAPEHMYRPDPDQDTLGAAAVLFGDSRGLNRGASRARLLTPETPGVSGPAKPWQSFGAALAIADFDGNGLNELAVGDPFYGVSESDGTTWWIPIGAVMIIEGGRNGFRQVSSTTITHDTAGMPGQSREYEGFGLTLAAGDVTGDGRADLALGATGPGGDVESSFVGYGAVYLLPGSRTGLTGRGSQGWMQSSKDVQGEADPEGMFGASLAIGRLDDDRYVDLAVGAPGDYIGDAGGGTVTLLRGSRGGLTTRGFGGRRLHEGVPGIAGSIGGEFGASLTLARVQGKRQANLIIGNPLGKPAGRIHQLRATKSRPDAEGTRSFHADTPGMKGKPGKYDSFGGELG